MVIPRRETSGRELKQSSRLQEAYAESDGADEWCSTGDGLRDEMEWTSGACEAEEAEEEVEEAWAQCDLCSKWRMLPPSMPVWDGAFACSMNLWDPRHDACEKPEGKWDPAEWNSDIPA
jgi:hypothetical protein